MSKRMFIRVLGKGGMLDFETIRPSLNPKMRHYILCRDKFTCRYCLDTKGPFEVDHVHPRSKGGPDESYNLVCSCKKCNRTKRDKLLSELGWELHGVH